MRKLTLLLLLFTGMSASAQFQDLKGFVMQATAVSTDGGDKNKTYQMYCFSLKDSTLVHLLYDDEGNFEDSQFYRLVKQNVQYLKDDKKTVFKLDVKSGISGSIYSYSVTIFDDGTGYLDLDTRRFYGGFFRVKTFNQ